MPPARQISLAALLIGMIAGVMASRAAAQEAQAPSSSKRQPDRGEAAQQSDIVAQSAEEQPPANPATPAGPIIPDQEFDRAVPPLDRAPPAQPTTPAPAPTPVDTSDIDQPLTPLSSFQVTPIDRAQYSEADDKPATVRYRYRIEGLDGLDGSDSTSPVTAGDIQDRFHDISALEEGDGKAANGAMISARMEQDQKLLLDVLQSQGFYDAQVHGALQLPDKGADGNGDGDDRITAILTATPGPRYALGDIRFDAPPVMPNDLITRNFVPKSGDPIVADRILSAEATLKVALPENGYPFAQTGGRDILLDGEMHVGDYTLPVQPGPRSSFGDFVIGGKKPVFKPKHIAEIARFKKGELYDSRKVDDLRRALVATGLLGTVSVEPQPTGEAAGDGTDYARIVVDQEAGPARTLAAELGYATGEGIKLQGSWTHRNLFPPEGALIGTATLGSQQQGIGGIFRRSNAGRRDRTVELSLTANHSDFDAYEAYTGRLAGSIAVQSTPIWQKKLTYSYGFELLASREQDYDFAAGERRARTYYIVALPGQATWDRSNSLLDPTRGWRLSATLSPEAALGAGTQFYGRGSVQATGYYPLGGFVLAGRLKVSSIAGAGREVIPPSRRIYAGGGGSVRGFGYQQLGPKDPDDRPIGGRSSVEASAEVRYRFGNFGVVGFVDAGQVYTGSVPDFTGWRFGAGIGARYYTNFGPLRLDVATPIDRRPGESRVAVYVSIGQAF